MSKISSPLNKVRLTNITSLMMAGLMMASLPGESLALKIDGEPLQDKLHPPASVDEIARQINQQPQWLILAAEPMVEDQKIMYRFKLLNKARGRVEVIVIDPEQPQLEQFNSISTESN